ncbi:hypothetical protein ACFC09_39440 [Streptomyces sp. NPDC056161]|uniref:hypothetical protein n=1 Tax=Streptomyces sp. NPDC056161 TaxID=3345732 RepID=UPI0035D5D48D
MLDDIVKAPSKEIRGAVWNPSAGATSSRRESALVPYLFPFASFREFVMADVAFVVTTIVLFALVAVVAKGVAKL